MNSSSPFICNQVNLYVIWELIKTSYFKKRYWEGSEQVAMIQDWRPEYLQVLMQSYLPGLKNLESNEHSGNSKKTHLFMKWMCGAAFLFFSSVLSGPTACWMCLHSGQNVNTQFTCLDTSLLGHIFTDTHRSVLHPPFRLLRSSHVNNNV